VSMAVAWKKVSEACPHAAVTHLASRYVSRAVDHVDAVPLLPAADVNPFSMHKGATTFSPLGPHPPLSGFPSSGRAPDRFMSPGSSSSLFHGSVPVYDEPATAGFVDPSPRWANAPVMAGSPKLGQAWNPFADPKGLASLGSTIPFGANLTPSANPMMGRPAMVDGMASYGIFPGGYTPPP
jgi:hypothetical protein